MTEWTLEGKISNPELFLQIIHTFGQTFYKRIGKNRYEAVYFSGSKAIYFNGKLSEAQLKSFEARAWEVKVLEVDENSKIVRIEE